MKNTTVITIFLLLGFLLAPLSGADAGELPPPDARPLSVILQSVEEQKLGSISEAEFDDGFWEVKVCASSACQKLYLDPRTAAEKYRRKTDTEEIPPANSMPISTIIQSVEARELGTITEVEFEHGFWEVELRKNKQKIKLIIDPMTGEPR